MHDPIAYIVEEGDTIYLCTLDDGKFVRLRLTPGALRRLAREAVESALSYEPLVTALPTRG